MCSTNSPLVPIRRCSHCIAIAWTAAGSQQVDEWLRCILGVRRKGESAHQESRMVSQRMCSTGVQTKCNRCNSGNPLFNHSQDKQLYASRRIIISNQTLVLQSITKASHGQYMCRATNAQGAVSSNDVYVDVKCKY